MQVVQKSLIVPVLKLNAEDQTITGPILRPEIRDRQKTVVTSGVIKSAAFDFASRLNVSKDGTRPGIMHADFSDGKLSIVELWLEKLFLTYGADGPELVSKMVWTDDYVANLPDSSYLYSPSGTAKDAASGRIFPVKDADGQVDVVRVYDAINEVRATDTFSAELKKSIIKSARDVLLVAVDRFAEAKKTFVPKGSWMGTVKVLDPKLWEGAEKGVYGGFSIGGKAGVVYEE